MTYRSKFFLSCPFGVSNILNSELKRLGYKPKDTFSAGTYIEGNREDMYIINLRSRIANKVYLQVAEKDIDSLDDLFAMTQEIERKDFVGEKQGITIKVQTKESQHTERVVQSIAQKAIFTKLSGDEKYEFDIRKKMLEVSILIQKNTAKILINTSGDALFKRGWRTQTGDAPLKENIAAALVLSTNWTYKQNLIDPFCGSGTICIEAAMLARNIAPGLQRSFGFECFTNFNAQKRQEIKETAKSKTYQNNYSIYGYDIDSNIIGTAQKNAQQAGVEDTITFKRKEFSPKEKYEGQIISNPPYGKRLETDTKTMYQSIGELFEKNINLKGGIITTYSEFGQFLEPNEWKQKVVFNGADDAKFCVRK